MGSRASPCVPSSQEWLNEKAIQKRKNEDHTDEHQQEKYQKSSCSLHGHARLVIVITVAEEPDVLIRGINLAVVEQVVPCRARSVSGRADA